MHFLFTTNYIDSFSCISDLLKGMGEEKVTTVIQDRL